MKNKLLIFGGSLLALIVVGCIVIPPYLKKDVVGAPQQFIIQTGSSTPLASMSIGIVSSFLSGVGTSTLFVYGTTTILTPYNTPYAFRVLNSATSSVFGVDTVNASTTASGILNAGSTTVSSLLVGNLNTGSCGGDAKISNGYIVCGTDATGAGATSDSREWITFPTNQFLTPTTTLGIVVNAASSTIFRLWANSLFASSSASVASISVADLASANVVLGGGSGGFLNASSSIGRSVITDNFLLNTGDIGLGVFDFGDAVSFEVPNGTGPTVDAAGEVAVDTSAEGQLVFYDGTSAKIANPYVPFKFWVGTSTLATRGGYGLTGTTTIYLEGYPYPVSFNSMRCRTNPISGNGTTTVAIGKGSVPNNSQYVVADDRATSTSITMSSNNTFIAFERIAISLGGRIGTADAISCDATVLRTQQ